MTLKVIYKSAVHLKRKVSSEVENSLGLFLRIFLYIFLFALFEGNKLLNFCFPVESPDKPLGALANRPYERGIIQSESNTTKWKTSNLKKKKTYPS